jgi:hypothetical protein
MRSTLIIAEGHEQSKDRVTQALTDVTRGLPGFVRGASYSCGENGDTWLVLEMAEPRFTAAARTRLADGAPVVRSLHEVHRMARNDAGQAVQVPGSAYLDTLGDYLMSVVLPVPNGRRDEWSAWYDTEHMPSVLTLETAIAVGHRFAPLDDRQPDAHLVLYEFPSAQALANFAGGGIPVAKKSAYAERWQVTNLRRTFGVLERINGRASVEG